ncbi:hypothetical protein RJT34_27083 [Clitoria ternatea]|uniref:Uncharacterized protein n=1 Tax=Clitoria ternatea TaxID=43366 RepID=A0AAN9F7E3_CLITE
MRGWAFTACQYAGGGSGRHGVCYMHKVKVYWHHVLWPRFMGVQMPKQRVYSRGFRSWSKAQCNLLYAYEYNWQVGCAHEGATSVSIPLWRGTRMKQKRVQGPISAA